MPEPPPPPPRGVPLDAVRGVSLTPKGSSMLLGEIYYKEYIIKRTEQGVSISDKMRVAMSGLE